MKAQDILMFGHNTVIKALEGIPDDAWETPGVVGVWSLKNVVAHMASFEQLLAEVLASLMHSDTPTPTLEQFRQHPDFNNSQVALRASKPPAEILGEYQMWHQKVIELADQLPPAAFNQRGILPWYGAEFDLQDYLIYSYYGHKREHSAQIALYRKRVTAHT